MCTEHIGNDKIFDPLVFIGLSSAFFENCEMYHLPQGEKKIHMYSIKNSYKLDILVLTPV